MSEQYFPQRDAVDERERSLPDRTVFPEDRPPHKSTFDLEDVTGNPGHRNSNPNIPPATVEQIVEWAAAGPASINEPPGRLFAAEAIEVAPAETRPPEEGPPSINEPPGSQDKAAPTPEEPPLTPENLPGQPQEQQQFGWQPQQPLRPY
jgi:hypothetical protein